LNELFNKLWIAFWLAVLAFAGWVLFGVIYNK
jgi:hypothetical protein